MDDGKYLITGIIHPQRAILSFAEQQPFNLKCSFREATLDLSICIILSKIFINISVLNFSDNYTTLKNILTDIVSDITNYIGLVNALSYTVEISDITNIETRETWVFGIQEPIFDDPNKEDLTKGMKIDTNLLFTISNNVQAQRALSDYKQAMIMPNDTSFFCFRAIESLRHYFSGSEKEQWELLSKTVEVGAEKISELKRSASYLRHGHTILQPWEKRKAELLLTREIILKFILFLQKETTDI